MKNLYLLLAAAVLIPGSVAAQSADCSGGRYFQEIFPNVDVTTDVTYGQNMNVDNQMQTLELDIYRPQGDVQTDRPLIILAHGGSFYAGDKSSADIVSLCNHFARMGYVAVSMEYRLESLLNILFSSDIEKTFLNIVYDAVCDQKAAIRFFRKSAAEGNPYGINPNIVIVGGVSAGSILSIHNAYLDDTTKFPAKIDPDPVDPLNGTSGNPGYSSAPQAIVNLCGAIGDTTWLEMLDQPFVSVHTQDDDVVPYGSDTANPGIPVMLVHGSYSMNLRAQNVDVTNPFLSFPTGGHCGFLSNQTEFDSTLTFVKTFLHDQICIQSLVTEQQPEAVFFSAYPNPAHNGFYIDIPGNADDLNATLVNMLGETVWAAKIPAGQNMMYVESAGMKSGMYILKLEAKGKLSSSKITIR